MGGRGAKEKEEWNDYIDEKYGFRNDGTASAKEAGLDVDWWREALISIIEELHPTLPEPKHSWNEYTLDNGTLFETEYFTLTSDSHAFGSYEKAKQAKQARAAIDFLNHHYPPDKD